MAAAMSLIRDSNPVASCEPQEAQRLISDVFSPHQLEVVGRGSSLNMVLHRIVLPNVTLGELAHGAEVEVTPGRLSSYYDINVVLAGHTRTTCGSEARATGAGDAAVLSPEMRSTMHWSADCRQLAIKIDRSALERELSALLGHPIEAPVAFEVLLDATGGLGKAWVRSITAMIEQFNEAPDLLQHQPVVARFESLLIGQLLATQPHNYSRELATGERTTVRPRRIQAVLDLIDQHPEHPLTVADFAHASGVSLRSLQNDFREQLGVPLMVYLRNVRLSRAHEDLVREAGDPESTASVADIAYRWGFGHVPRFAAAYRNRYGHAPSATLRGQ